MKEFDMVNHPKHYNSHPSGIECVDLNEHMSGNLAAAFKYLWRAGLKGAEAQDQQKAAWYLRREAARLQQRHTEAPAARMERLAHYLVEVVNHSEGQPHLNELASQLCIGPDGIHPYGDVLRAVQLLERMAQRLERQLTTESSQPPTSAPEAPGAEASAKPIGAEVRERASLWELFSVGTVAAVHIPAGGIFGEGATASTMEGTFEKVLEHLMRRTEEEYTRGVAAGREAVLKEQLAAHAKTLEAR